MRNRFLIFFVGFMIHSNASFGSDSDSTKIKMIIAASGGFSQNNSLSGDVFGGIIIPFNSKQAEINFGYTYFNNNTKYGGVDDLKFNSHGLFLEGNYYLIKGFYGGLKFAVNFNWIDNESQRKFDNLPDTDSPTFFSGIAGYAHLGYYQPIGDKIGIKLQGQIGLHNYKIAEGWLLIDNSSSDVRNAQFGIERHAELLNNISIGLTFKL